jgi:aryl-alcohol dehydrogenase-like predicted oxidoreductase
MSLGYTLFGHGTGLRVSPLALGTALFGTTWGYGAEADEATAMLTTYLEAGGNFIDTADSYQCGQAETILGAALKGRRDGVVLASKYTLGAAAQGGVLTTGNSRKSMARAVEASLARLGTDHIDLYWVHMADGVTAMEEIVRGLDDLVRTGKILYAGISDFPAWRVAHARTLADLRGWSPIVALQIEYSLAERAGDRELLPMARAFGMGVTTWSPLGGGLLTGKYRRGEPGRATTFGHVVHREDDARKTATLDALLDVAAEVDATPGQVALAWQMAQGLVPIIGPRTVEQLRDNLGTARLHLTAEQRTRLDRASAVPLGFPHDFLAADPQRLGMSGGHADIIAPPPMPVR